MAKVQKTLEIQIFAQLNKFGMRTYALEIWHNLENANANPELFIDRPQLLWQDLTNDGLENKLKKANAWIMGYYA